MNLQPILKGKLIKTRPLKSEDFEDLYRAASDPLIWQQHPDPLRYKRDVFKEYFDSGLASHGCLVIQSRQTDEVIGSSRFYDWSADNRMITIGFTFLLRKLWGGSYNRELKHLMLTHAFDFAETVIFDVGSENIRSRKALEKIGAKLISQNEKIASDGRKLKALVYSIHRAEFKGLLESV